MAARRSTGTLDSVGIALEPDTLVNVASYGMLFHIACTLGLRYSIEPDTALFDELFGRLPIELQSYDCCTASISYLGFAGRAA